MLIIKVSQQLQIGSLSFVPYSVKCLIPEACLAVHQLLCGAAQPESLPGGCYGKGNQAWWSLRTAGAWRGGSVVKSTAVQES